MAEATLLTGESDGLLIGGAWQSGNADETMTATNPATGETIAELPAGSRDDVRNGIAAARSAAESWAGKTAFERAAVCREIAEAIRDEADALSALLTRDQGKPIAEARYEVDLCADEFDRAAAAVETQRTDVFPSEDPDKRTYTMREPHGVLGVITPWNFPVNIPAEYLAPGLAVGNTVVWVPAPTTAAIAVGLARVIAETAIPDGALNLVTGEGPVVGDELVVGPTDAVGFTGSPETGETVAQKAGTKPTLLELGGNGPVILWKDADLDAAIECTANGCFANAGQICSASERILVHEEIYAEVRDRLVAEAEQRTLGDPRDPETDMGPLNNDEVAAKMDRHVTDAVEKGATVHTGGERASGHPTDRFYEPTVLGDVTAEMLVNEAETFGPIAPLIPVAEYDEAIRITNGIDLGLAASVFTSDIGRAERFARDIEAGIVNVNASSTHWEIHTPAGGYTGKRSGRGRVGIDTAVEELSQLKTVSVDHGHTVARSD